MDCKYFHFLNAGTEGSISFPLFLVEVPGSFCLKIGIHVYDI